MRTAKVATVVEMALYSPSAGAVATKVAVVVDTALRNKSFHRNFRLFPPRHFNGSGGNRRSLLGRGWTGPPLPVLYVCAILRVLVRRHSVLPWSGTMTGSRSLRRETVDTSPPELYLVPDESCRDAYAARVKQRT